MGLTIPAEELELCMELARPGYAALGLTNDLFSWEKEREDARKAGIGHVFNAIWVIMQEQGVDEAGASAICEDEIRRYVVEFDGIVEETRRSDLSRDTRAYQEAVRQHRGKRRVECRVSSLSFVVGRQRIPVTPNDLNNSCPNSLSASPAPKTSPFPTSSLRPLLLDSFSTHGCPVLSSFPFAPNLHPR